MNCLVHRKYNPYSGREYYYTGYYYYSLGWLAFLLGPAVSIVKTVGLSLVLALPFSVAPDCLHLSLVTEEPTSYECEGNTANSSPVQDSHPKACVSGCHLHLWRGISSHQVSGKKPGHLDQTGEAHRDDVAHAGSQLHVLDT